MGVEFQQISGDAQRALEEFRMEFAGALTQGAVETWAKNHGLYNQSNALKTTYPIPIGAALYKEFKGDVKYRSLFERSVTLIPKTWQDGVSELASVIEAPDFTGWAQQPTAMAMAAQCIHNELVAAALKANAVQEFDEKAFFASDHPVNIFDSTQGVFDNDLSGAVSIAGLKAMKAHFRSIKSPNGKPMGLRLTHWFVRPEDEETALDLLERDLIVESGAAVDNRHKGTVKLVVMDEHDDGVNHYGAAFNKPGMFPWITQDQGTPEEILSDKSSALYASTLKVGVAYVLRGNAGLALPHCMVRLDGTD